MINPTPLCTPSLHQTHGALAHQPTMHKWALPKQQGLATSLDMSPVPAGSTVLLNHTMLIPTARSQTSQQGLQSGRGCTSTPLHTLRVCCHCTTAQQQPPLLLRSAGLLGCLLVCQAATGSQQCCCPLAMPQATHIHGVMCGTMVHGYTSHAHVHAPSHVQSCFRLARPCSCTGCTYRSSQLPAQTYQGLCSSRQWCRTHQHHLQTAAATAAAASQNAAQQCLT